MEKFINGLAVAVKFASLLTRTLTNMKNEYPFPLRVLPLKEGRVLTACPSASKCQLCHRQPIYELL